MSKQKVIDLFTMKDSNYVKINGVNPLYLIVVEVDGCIEEKNGKKYWLWWKICEN